MHAEAVRRLCRLRFDGERVLARMDWLVACVGGCEYNMGLKIRPALLALR